MSFGSPVRFKCPGCQFGLYFNKGKLRVRTCPFCRKDYELKDGKIVKVKLV